MKRWPEALYILMCVSVVLLIALSQFGAKSVLAALWSSPAAGWVQALGSIAAIIFSVLTGIELQDRARRISDSYEARTQIAALRAIAQRCVLTLERLDERAQGGKFRPDILGYLTDEISADEVTVSSVDLMSIKSSIVISLVAELQEQVRTGRRRLGYLSPAIRKGRQVPHDQFSPALEKSKKVLASLTELASEIEAKVTKLGLADATKD